MPDSIVEVRIKNNPILYDRQKDVLLHVILAGRITRGEYMQRTGVSASTASRASLVGATMQVSQPFQYWAGSPGMNSTRSPIAYR